tara:strand:+ start:683 stop:874 length:192 start_codon:yes stop_codon:yes gene_type:complete
MEDRKSLIKGIMYLIRDVLHFSELFEIKQFLEDIMEDKYQSGYVSEQDEYAEGGGYNGFKGGK